jgi:hypothetical protein
LKEKLIKSSKRRVRLVAWDRVTLLTAVVLACLSFAAFEAGSWAYNVAEQNFRAAGALKAAAETVRLAQEIAKLTAEVQKKGAPPPKTTTTAFQVCQGEFPEQCPPGSKWVNCYVPIKDFLDPICTSLTSTRISTRGGNRCGYSVDQIICTKSVSPGAATLDSPETPNIGGKYTCGGGTCRGDEQIIQSGVDITCILTF